MASLRDIEHIYIARGICHVVASERDGWLFTLCDIWATGSAVKGWPLKAKVCRKCRERLKDATKLNS